MKKMIQSLPLFLCLGITCFSEAKPQNMVSLTQSANKTESSTPVNLSGNLLNKSHGGTRSVFESIILQQYTQHLEATLDNGLGIITILLFDAMSNVVYQTQVNTSIQNQVKISLSNYDTGIYTIKFIDAQDRYLEGMLVVQN